MQYKRFAPAASSAADVLVVGVFQDENLKEILASAFAESNLAVRLDQAKAQAKTGAKTGKSSSHKLAEKHSLLDNFVLLAREEKFSGKTGQFLVMPTYGAVAFKKVVLCGLGKPEAFEAGTSRKMGASLAKQLKTGNAGRAVLILRNRPDTVSSGKPSKIKQGALKSGTAKSSPSNSAPLSFAALDEKHAVDHVRAFVEGWHLATFAFNKYKSNNGDEREKAPRLSELSFCGTNLSEAKLQAVCRLGELIGEATNMARQLIAEPPCFMTPSKLAEQAESIAEECHLRCQILDEKAAQKLGMGSFLGVAKGATEPPRFIVLKYEPKAAKRKSPPKAIRRIAIVGKGITFDSGGLSLKPAASMEHMKYDMSGAAVVLATMKIIGHEKPDHAVMGVIAATENMPGGNALHPGDVLRAMNGKTIEVNNTDAEGRLVLADALTYSAQNGAEEMIDVATLTGAIVTALGRAAAGIMGNNQLLIDHLIQSASRAGEKLWQMPMFEEYKESLKSDVADLKNAGARGEAGSSCAAMFLQEFCAGKKWAHLDIAGPGWLEKPRDELNKGGTAFGVRTLTYYLLGL